MKDQIPLVILAAGASTRMGKAKQLLTLDGELLLHRIIRIGRAAGFSPIVVVTGARQEAIADALANQSVLQVHNADWESGMGSSVQTGLEAALDKCPEAGAVGFALTDQPYVSAALLRAMVERLLDSNAPGVAASYKKTLGVPAIFRKPLFDALKKLRGAKGAKPVLEKYASQLLPFPFPQGHIDLDTPEDWQAFLGRTSRQP